ncbi:MAG: hypothetical protein WC209_03205 [Ignavibacteriaceae bacterium]
MESKTTQHGAKSFRVVKQNEKKDDFAFWQSQPYEKRLEALESIREEYNYWKYGNQQGFQRVYRVIKKSEKYL